MEDFFGINTLNCSVSKRSVFSNMLIWTMVSFGLAHDLIFLIRSKIFFQKVKKKIFFAVCIFCIITYHRLRLYVVLPTSLESLSELCALCLAASQRAHQKPARQNVLCIFWVLIRTLVGWRWKRTEEVHYFKHRIICMIEES